MAFCQKCGAQLPENSGFCSSCGAAAGAQAQATGHPVGTAAPNTSDQSKPMAILAVVIPILFFLPLVSGEKTEFGTFWANQALLLLLAEILSSVLAVILIGLLLGFVVFVFWIIAIISVCKGEMKPIPLIGQIKIIK